MRVETAKQAALRRGGDKPADGSLAQSGDDAGRALVILEPVARQEPQTGHREVQFLAQLIATRDQLPQTRERRRAEPAEVIAAYRAADALIAR
jgi:hypothetical protein